MVLAVKVPRTEGEKVRRKLLERGVLDRGYKIKVEGDYILIPVTSEVEGFDIVDVELEKAERRPHSYREVVKIPETLQKFLPSSFDIIGDIAIIEIPEELKGYEREIGEAIIKVHKNVKAVFMKGGNVEGEYRVRELIPIAGEKRTETIHRENGIRLKLDVAKVYFSPRLATERMRIFNRTKAREVVFDMFAGVGPYSILLAKKAKIVFACDINPWAIRYMEQNIKLNKTWNVVPILGDAREVAKKVKADRIIMNLPRFAKDFLREAFTSAKNGTIIHYYGFGPEKDPFEDHIWAIKRVAREFNADVEILDKRIIRNYAPRRYNIAIDFKVTFS
ncbi:tRNA (guanine-N1)-methyltransferase [Thermococcus chitonophagus]|uniref:tRNA (guanine(37)-N(1))-methyltransferase Trm5b n=1 Tax=Thermococcus chitonophagus TaxID=54262 RepID=A0A160VTY6_9EURY|nr:class I SAM-dependent methyltransferase family protein [Thermococcus chitonophagus]ASJ16958.1 tRNA (guanine-N1)-methyltransferase [Thermococcus chitonophagus]CUX78440.1 tRNA (Guanine37-N1)-methyltransferase [Thermococcus chitonophagus]